ncbi:MAG TPA: glycosyltransferase family 39 protein [Candidatus Angelobacter sp.]
MASGVHKSLHEFGITEKRLGHRVSPATLLSCSLVAVFLAMRLWRLTYPALNGDEIFSLLLARSDWHGLMAGAVQDAIHPPLFYVLLKVWTWLGGESLLWLRLFPVAVSLLCLAPFLLLCRRLEISPMARNLALGIAAVHPYAIFFAQETRMYCLLGLGALVSAWYFLRYLDQPSRRNLAWLTLVNLLLVYTHYYGWLIVGLEFVYLMWLRRGIRAFAASMLIIAVLFAPWAWAAGQVLHGRGLQQNLGWLPRPHLGDVTWFFSELAGFAEYPKHARVAAAVVLTLLAVTYRRNREPGMQWLVWLWILPAPLVFLASQWLPQSIWGHRHLIFTLWPFVMVLADSVWRRGWMLRAAVVIAAGIWAGFAIASRNSDDHYLPSDSLTLAILDHEPHNGIHIPLYAVDPYLHYPLWFFMENLKHDQLGPFGPHLDPRRNVSELAAKAAEFEIIKAADLEAAQQSYFWAGYSEPWKQGPTPRQILEKRGCQIGLEVTARSRFQTVIFFPVQCNSNRESTSGPS